METLRIHVEIKNRICTVYTNADAPIDMTIFDHDLAPVGRAGHPVLDRVANEIEHGQLRKVWDVD